MSLLSIGLTGGIGTGKTTVARELAALGAVVISGDELGRQVLEESAQLQGDIRARFGSEVFAPDGSIHRRKLADRVFVSDSATTWLTRATFPGIIEKWKKVEGECRAAVIVFDAALIFEWGIENEFDLVLLVSAPRDQVMKRARTAGRFSEAEISQRLAGQSAASDVHVRAHSVIRNDGSLSELSHQVATFWQDFVLPRIQTNQL